MPDHMDLWVRLLAATREAPVDAAALAWRYLDNPHGMARAWVIVDESTNEVGGFTVVLPRRMRLGARTLLAWVGADFSILPRYRALGPALQLRRAARQAIDDGAADFLFAFPNQAMRVIHERAGHLRLGDLRRYAFPANVAFHLERAGVPGWAARALALPGGAIRDLSGRARSLLAGDRVRILRELSRATLREVTVAAERLTFGRVAGIRDSTYLEWRYARQPGWHGGVIMAMRTDDCAGYLVFTEERDLLQIADFAALDARAAATLLGVAVRLARKRGSVSVSYVGLEKGIWDDLLTTRGFRPREEHHAVYAYVPARHASLIDAQAPGHWHLTVGDRDV